MAFLKGKRGTYLGYRGGGEGRIEGCFTCHARDGERRAAFEVYCIEITATAHEA